MDKYTIVLWWSNELKAIKQCSYYATSYVITEMFSTIRILVKFLINIKTILVNSNKKLCSH